jgi:hypothetical protein
MKLATYCFAKDWRDLIRDLPFQGGYSLGNSDFSREYGDSGFPTKKDARNAEQCGHRGMEILFVRVSVSEGEDSLEGNVVKVHFIRWC